MIFFYILHIVMHEQIHTLYREAVFTVSDPQFVNFC
jgi:hypothetical protein